MKRLFSFWRAATWLDRALLLGVGAFAVYVLGGALVQPNLAYQFLWLRDMHWWLSRIGLGIAAVMFAAATYVGILRHGDVTPQFRRVVYAVEAFVVVMALVGAWLYFLLGMRPHEEVHLIYGAGVVLSLPYFIFVEATSKKRPAMGSYMWAFGLLFFIMIRSIMTGAAG